MSFMDRWTKKSNELGEREALDSRTTGEPMDEALQQALVDFKLSIHAWSDAELSRPRTLAQGVRHRSWRLAAGVALGCTLIAGGVSGGIYERHQRQQEAAKIAAEARAAQQQRLVAAEKTRQDEEDLLAKVDSDVSRETPSAMEPLAQLMAEDEVQK